MSYLHLLVDKLLQLRVRAPKIYINFSIVAPKGLQEWKIGLEEGAQ